MKKQKIEKLMSKVNETNFDISIVGDKNGRSIILSDFNKEVIIDILNNSNWFHLELYNIKKDTFHYTTKRKSVKAVINYIFKHLE